MNYEKQNVKEKKEQKTILKTIKMRHIKELIEYAIDGINDNGEGTQGCELHHILFNEDYYIVGYYEAEKWLEANGGPWEAIRIIQEYEDSTFGERFTDLSDSEKVVNMFVYIKGEEILAESKTLQDKWNDELIKEDCNQIIEEIEELL